MKCPFSSQVFKQTGVSNLLVNSSTKNLFTKLLLLHLDARPTILTAYVNER